MADRGYKFYDNPIYTEDEEFTHIAYKLDNGKIVSFERNENSENLNSMIIWDSEEIYRDNMNIDTDGNKTD